MSCREVKSHLAVFADGELDDELQATVAGHLATCPECRAVVERWQALRRCAHPVRVAQPVPPAVAGRMSARMVAPARAAR